MMFCLNGNVHYVVGSCHDSRTAPIEKWFEADTEKKAIAIAREIVLEYHKKHNHLTDYTMNANLSIRDFNSRKLIKRIWETHWQDAQPYIPPEPARPARKAGFRSRRYK